MAKEIKFFRIGDLERLTKMPRRTIHFYIYFGLLHQPVRTGKTMAYYDEAHLRKLLYIQKAKHQGLPLVIIRQMIQREEKNRKGFGLKGINSVIVKKNHRDKKISPQKDRGRKTRERILQAGSNLFEQKGYKNTAVSDITWLLGIGRGSFYSYFSDKKELFLECAPMIFEELFSKGWNLVRKEKDPYRRLLLRIEISWPVIRKLSTMLQLSKEALQDVDPKIRELGAMVFLSFFKPIESDIKEGINKGIFRKLDPGMLSCILIGFIESLEYFLAFDPKFSLMSLRDTVIDLLATVLRKGYQNSA